MRSQINFGFRISISFYTFVVLVAFASVAVLVWINFIFITFSNFCFILFFYDIFLQSDNLDLNLDYYCGENFKCGSNSHSMCNATLVSLFGASIPINVYKFNSIPLNWSWVASSCIRNLHRAVSMPNMCQSLMNWSNY